jgi:hypothetical protein
MTSQHALASAFHEGVVAVAWAAVGRVGGILGWLWSLGGWCWRRWVGPQGCNGWLVGTWA